MANPIEALKNEKQGLDVWPDVLRHAGAHTPMSDIAVADLERMKWYGVFYRKRDTPGTYMLLLAADGHAEADLTIMPGGQAVLAGFLFRAPTEQWPAMLHALGFAVICCATAPLVMALRGGSIPSAAATPAAPETAS